VGCFKGYEERVECEDVSEDEDEDENESGNGRWFYSRRMLTCCDRCLPCRAEVRSEEKKRVVGGIEPPFYCF
jgi:hypothetical protein